MGLHKQGLCMVISGRSILLPFIKANHRNPVVFAQNPEDTGKPLTLEVPHFVAGLAKTLDFRNTAH